MSSPDQSSRGSDLSFDFNIDIQKTMVELLRNGVPEFLGLDDMSDTAEDKCLSEDGAGKLTNNTECPPAGIFPDYDDPKCSDAVSNMSSDSCTTTLLKCAKNLREHSAIDADFDSFEKHLPSLASYCSATFIGESTENVTTEDENKATETNNDAMDGENNPPGNENNAVTHANTNQINEKDRETSKSSNDCSNQASGGNDYDPDLQQRTGIKSIPPNEPGDIVQDNSAQNMSSHLPMPTLSMRQREMLKDFWTHQNTGNLLEMGLIHYLVTFKKDDNTTSTDVDKLIEICKKTSVQELISSSLHGISSSQEQGTRNIIIIGNKKTETEDSSAKLNDKIKCGVRMEEFINSQSQMESGKSQSEDTRSLNLENNDVGGKSTLAGTSSGSSCMLRRSATIPEKIAYLREYLAEGEATLRSARTDMHRCTKRSDKLEAGGNVLFPALFTNSEIIDGNVSGKRSDKNPNGNKYSESKVDLLSELLDWRLERQMEDTLDEFEKYLKETKSVGLGESEFKELKQTILVNYANHIRPKKPTAKRQKKEKTETCSNKRIKKS